MPVLANGRVGAALPCQDFERAKNWYKEMLGFSPVEENPGGAYYECAEGTMFFVFPSMGKATGDHTQMGFMVDDAKAEVAELKKAGVVFEEYDYPELKTVDSIADIGDSVGAWFKDSEGNMLAVFERTT
jgi:catechol 2,3-dioxygenase-like lactoylglutathione lyase family enzyme